MNNFMITNIPEDIWTATKVMVALMGAHRKINLKIFVLEAIQEKLAKEKAKMKKDKNLK